MAAISLPSQPTRDAIYKWYEDNQEDSRRPHLGASLIGRDCERQLWYTFRWALRKRHDGRLLRLFEVGHTAEPRFVAGLRGAGVEVHEVDPAGKQWRVSLLGGHAAGSLDGAAVGIKEAPKTWHVLEFKTHGDDSFKKLTKDGVKKAKPEHYSQMQVYMGETGMERAFYLAENKNTSELYSERIEFDPSHYAALKAKFQRIITSAVPLDRIAKDPSFFQCKFCDYSDICHDTKLPDVNCRTCAHSTPELDGEGGRWSCALAGRDSSIPLDAQRNGCGDHRYIPILLEKSAKQVDYDEATGRVIYELHGGGVFANGSHEDSGAWPSADIQKAGDMRVLAEPDVQKLRADYPTTAVVA